MYRFLILCLESMNFESVDIEGLVRRFVVDFKVFLFREVDRANVANPFP